MATFKTSELLQQIHEIISDGYDYVDINFLDEEADEDGDVMPAFLSFSVDEDEYMSIDYDGVWAVEDNEQADDISSESDPDAPCGSLSFTNGEISVIANAIGFTLDCLNEYLKSPDCVKDERDSIKLNCSDLRNLRAKISKKFILPNH